MRIGKVNSVHKILHKAVKQFSKGHFDESWLLLITLESHSLSGKELKNLHKVINLLIIGELFGLHNPSQMNSFFGISSSNLYKTWRKFSHQQIMNIANDIFWVMFRDRMIKLCQKSDSTWSRSQVTLVVDSSIYKQYLSNPDDQTDGTSKLYDKFFSGQTKSTVYGFRLTLIGIVIDGVFFPINYYVSSKAHKEVEVGNALVKRVGKKLESLQQMDGVDFPNLFMSADNTFCEDSFFQANQDIGVDPISVPNKNWLFEIDNETINLKSYIEKLKQQEEQGQKDVFPHRKRAYRKGFGEMVLLFFRLKKGHKINVIMTSRLDVKAKTLRRRWFQRTYIEQFFRFSKHTLQIQESKSENVSEFIRKMALNFLKTIICQLFTVFCRGRFRTLKKMSFYKIRHQLVYHNHKIEIKCLHQIMFKYDDLLQTTIPVTY